MVIFEEKVRDVFIHGEAASPCGVVPGNVDGCIEIAFPIIGDVVVLLDDVTQVMGMFLANVFNAKVVNN